MFAQFRYLEGPRAGETRALGTDFATIGRHPNSDIPFDPERDLAVSIRHAAVFKQGGGFLVRDLGSTNGTLVNGRRVRGDRPLESGDVLQLGPDGPRLEFTVVANLPIAVRSSKPHTMPRTDPAMAVAAPDLAAIAPLEPERPTVAARESNPAFWRWTAAIVVTTGVLTASGISWEARRSQARLERERMALLTRVDNLLARLEQTKTKVANIDSVLRRARTDVGSFRRTVATERLSEAKLDTLAKSLLDQASKHETVIRAASLDPSAVVSTEGSAVTVVIAQFGNGQVRSGSGFSVKTRGDTAWVVTIRGLVQDSAGAAATQLAVIFNGSGQAFRASIESVHDSVDLAVLTARIHGGVPVVKGISDSAAAGEAVAMVGFPGGIDSLGAWRAKGALATASIGTVTLVQADLLELDGYGTHGSSGSPVFSPTGEVVGVVFGGPVGADGRVFAVPGRKLRALINR